MDDQFRSAFNIAYMELGGLGERVLGKYLTFTLYVNLGTKGYCSKNLYEIEILNLCALMFNDILLLSWIWLCFGIIVFEVAKYSKVYRKVRVDCALAPNDYIMSGNVGGQHMP